jgi:hypothetical protein
MTDHDIAKGQLIDFAVSAVIVLAAPILLAILIG